MINIFIYANDEYRIKKLKEMYGDDEKTAKQNIKKSDKSRSNYYKNVTGKEFGNVNNYDLCINSSIGVEKTAEIILDYISKRNNA